MWSYHRRHVVICLFCLRKETIACWRCHCLVVNRFVLPSLQRSSFCCTPRNNEEFHKLFFNLDFCDTKMSSEFQSPSEQIFGRRRLSCPDNFQSMSYSSCSTSLITLIGGHSHLMSSDWPSAYKIITSLYMTPKMLLL